VVAFSPDGKRLASVSGGGGPNAIGEVKVWDAQTGKELLRNYPKTGVTALWGKEIEYK
jgi:hypothetical protein